jgi:hypothetical protein
MATVVGIQQVTCPECGAVYVVQAWSCGCLIRTEVAGGHCFDCFGADDLRRCGKRGKPEEH